MGDDVTSTAGLSDVGEKGVTTHNGVSFNDATKCAANFFKLASISVTIFFLFSIKETVVAEGEGVLTYFVMAAIKLAVLVSIKEDWTSMGTSL